jgi:hypothetical protein
MGHRRISHKTFCEGIKMNVKIKKISGWDMALMAARMTVPDTAKNHDWKDKEPSRKWKLKMLFSEHSPIRMVKYWIEFEGAKRWVLGHILRHWVGVIPFVSSQRTDRRGIPRDDLPQGEPSDMGMEANAQSIISISRKRMCYKASKETREAWNEVHTAIMAVDPELSDVMVPECVYRGMCPESESCGWIRSDIGQSTRDQYESLNRFANGRGDV